MEKTNDLNIARYSMIGLAVVLAVYIGLGLHWGIPNILTGKMTWGMVLGVITGLVIVGVSYYLCILNPKSVAFLNETESELRKVIWPKARPVSSSTELWQYTIAVIALMVVLVVYIFVVDLVITKVTSYIIF